MPGFAGFAADGKAPPRVLTPPKKEKPLAGRGFSVVRLVAGIREAHPSLRLLLLDYGVTTAATS